MTQEAQLRQLLQLASAAKMQAELGYSAQLKKHQALQDEVEHLRRSVQSSRRASQNTVDLEGRIRHENWVWKKIEAINKELITMRIGLSEVKNVHQQAAAKELVLKALNDQAFQEMKKRRNRKLES